MPEEENKPDELRKEDEILERGDADTWSAPGAASAWGDVEARPRHRGPVSRAEGRICIGRVGAPLSLEATSREFYFWIPDDALVEVSQIVTVRSAVKDSSGNTMVLTYHALIEEVRRCSRRKGMGHEVDEADGDLNEVAPFVAEGMTYAQTSILRIEPPRLTPPRERSEVLVASDAEARAAYGAADGELENPLAVGLIRNGGSATAGPGFIDLDYLLGTNGGHLNVNGAAGRGTKSSFLLFIVRQLLDEAQRRRQATPTARPEDPEPLLVVPIIFNVKNYDLFYIDKLSNRYDRAKHEAAWMQIGDRSPRPFEGTTFFAPQQPNGTLAQMTQREGVRPYSWSLEDVIRNDLFSFLFSDEDANNDNFSVLIMDLEAWLTRETLNGDGRITLSLEARQNQNNETMNTFDRLLDWLSDPVRVTSANGLSSNHSQATVRKLHRRLQKILLESRGVLRRRDVNGNPLSVVRDDTAPPQVIDLSGLAGAGAMQRFVVATVLRQLVRAQTERPVTGMKYLVVLDELNRFAPRGGRDPITRLIEQVASEMRSQGVLLFGAQQQASLVSEKVIENAGIKALGKTGMLELNNSVWRGLSGPAKVKADSLLPDEKLILQDNFRQPMQVRVPFPAWAMRRAEAILTSAGGAGGTAAASDDPFIDP